jgi:hypothetical protein
MFREYVFHKYAHVIFALSDFFQEVCLMLNRHGLNVLRKFCGFSEENQ